jgi:hypothetical protein
MLKRFSEYLTEQELLCEMAHVGFVGDLEVCVFSREGGNIPHVHVHDAGTLGKEFDACVKLESPEYFSHGSHTDKLNTGDKHRLDRFMNDDPNDGVFRTNYEAAVYMWNKSNPQHKVEIERYDDGRPIIPDYTTLH